jgi:septal ring factor EnvC (AmiA/AmiB activator)
VNDEHEFQPGPPPELQQRRNGARRLLAAFALAISAIVLIHVGLNSASRFQARSTAADPLTETRKDFRSFQGQTDEALQSVTQDIAAQRKDLRSFQGKTGETLQSVTKDIVVQRDDLKNLSDQLTALVARIEMLQGAAAAAQVTAAVPEQPPVTATPKKPNVPKPARRIAVRRAPLAPSPPNVQ